MNISSIKTRLSIVEVLRQYGLQPDANNRLLCPFHADRTPSMQVYPENNRFTCFSTNCSAGSGDVIDFVRLQEQCSAKEAIERARVMAGVNGVAVPSSSIEAQSTAVSTEELSLVLEQVWHVWRRGYAASSVGRSYCTLRGLGVGLEAGYNSGTFHHGKPESFVQACVQLGLLLPPHGKPQGSGGYRSFAKECVVFALRDRQGRVCSFYGRSTRNVSGSSHYYLKNRSGLYPEYPESNVERVILCESVVDAASLLGTAFVLGSTTVLALYGTNGFTEEHREALVGLSELKEVVLWFDGDEAGRKATEKWGAVLGALCPHVAVSVVAMADGTDINGVLVESGALALADLYHRRFSFSQAEAVASEKEKALLPATTEEPQQNGLDTANANALVWSTELAHYTVLGGVRPDVESMKVTLRVQTPSGVQRIKLDLYHDEQVEKVCRRVGDKLQLRSELLERDLIRLTDLLEAYRTEQQQKAQAAAEPQPVRVVGAERTQAMLLLKHPQMFVQLHSLIGQSGVVGEEHNRVLAFVCCSSYRSGAPLHLISQGASGQGKTHLQEAIARLMPPEDVIQVTRMSEYSFYHFGENQLSYKLFICEDLDGMGEEALLALREMQSKGWIAGVVTVKDEHGNFSTRHKIVRGPLATAGATTRGYLYEDNASRCFVIAVDESAEQTARIIAYQNQLYAGKVNTQRQAEVRRLVQNCLRLLEPCEVVNPYAEQLSLPEGIIKQRRTNAHYHELIKTITWLHQYGRSRDSRKRLVTEVADIELANKLVAESLWQKIDDLDGSLRTMFERLKSYVRRVGGKEYRNYLFGRKEIRDALRLSSSHEHRCLQNLEASEYIRQTGTVGRGAHRYRIEVWDDVEAERRRVAEHLKKQSEAVRKRREQGGKEGESSRASE